MLSIIIPCYNASKYIINCLKSIENAGKNYQDLYEIIIVNDGSTDNINDILTTYNLQSPIRGGVKIINIKNQGVSNARNIGIENAQGEYIWFIDADDDITAQSISIILKTLKIDAPDILLFGFNLIKNNQLEQQEIFISKNNLNNEDIIEKVIPILFGYSQKNLDRLFKGQSLTNVKGFMHGAVWHYIFKRSIIINNKLLFPNIALNEDTMFILKYLCYVQKMKVISEHLYNYYLSLSGSMSRILNNPILLFNNKLKLAEERNNINILYIQKHQLNLAQCYNGSLLLSAMELCIKLSKHSYKHIKLFKQYCSFLPVRQAIKSIDTSNAPLKYKLPIFLLKNNYYNLLYTLIYLYQKIIYQIKI